MKITELADDLKALVLGWIGVWKAYTPTLTNITLGNGTMTTRYATIGNVVIYSGYFIMGSTSSITGVVAISLPFQAANNAAITYEGSGRILDSGTRFYEFTPSIANNDTTLTTFVFDGALVYQINATAPMTWTTNDQLRWMCIYERA